MKVLQRIIVGSMLISPIVIGILLALPGVQSTTGVAGGGVGFKKLGLVVVEGIIMESASTIEQLQQLRDDKSVAGVIMRVNSPGGATAPSQEIYHAVKEFTASGKPLVVSMGTVAASGGYYISCPAQKIFAVSGTITGSIGVIMTVPLYKDLAKKVGVEMRTFKAGAYKDLASTYRSMSPVEQEMIQELLDDTHDQFISDVAAERSMSRDTLVQFADGRIFTGRQASQNGLVDTLGSYEQALAYLRNLTGVSVNARVINKRETSATIREWFVREMVKIVPSTYRLIAPVGLHCLAVFDE